MKEKKYKNLIKLYKNIQLHKKKKNGLSRLLWKLIIRDLNKVRKKKESILIRKLFIKVKIWIKILGGKFDSIEMIFHYRDNPKKLKDHNDQFGQF